MDRNTKIKDFIDSLMLELIYRKREDDLYQHDHKNDLENIKKRTML